MQNYALIIWMGEEGAIETDPGFELDVHRYVFYSGEIVPEDCFPYSRYEKELQEGTGIAERLFNGVRRMFDYRFEKVILINHLGTKLPQLVLRNAFNALDDVDVVLVPSGTNDLVLIGLKKPLLRLFRQSVWESEELLLDLLLLMKEKGISYEILSDL